jgi:hypothetical protein
MVGVGDKRDDRDRPRTGRATNGVLWLMQVVVAIAFVGVGSAKLSGDASMVAMFATIGIGQWFRFVTGGLEIVGAALADTIHITTGSTSARLCDGRSRGRSRDSAGQFASVSPGLADPHRADCLGAIALAAWGIRTRLGLVAGAIIRIGSFLLCRRARTSWTMSTKRSTRLQIRSRR